MLKAFFETVTSATKVEYTIIGVVAVPLLIIFLSAIGFSIDIILVGFIVIIAISYFMKQK